MVFSVLPEFILSQRNMQWGSWAKSLSLILGKDLEKGLEFMLTGLLIVKN